MNFGYPWWMTYGHLVLAIPFALAAIWLSRIRRVRWLKWLLVAAAIWATAAFLVTKFGFRLDSTVKPPTANFLTSGSGVVLDMGCGSGRASIGLLLARKEATVIGIDNWSADYIQENSPDLILANAQAAGVADRLSTKSADMRELPFADGTFDAVMSAYALDHLDPPGIMAAVAEAVRVLRPGGEFLILNMHMDAWTKFAIPILLLRHSRRPLHQAQGKAGHDIPPADEQWRALFEHMGLEVVEIGRRPGTMYFLARKSKDAASISKSEPEEAFPQQCGFLYSN